MKQYQQEDQDFSNFSEVLMECTNKIQSSSKD